MVENLTLSVSGMTCGGCENAVKRTLLKLDGVHDVTASHRDRVVTVRYETDKVGPATIHGRIESLGYKVTG
jgi:copper chaperone